MLYLAAQSHVPLSTGRHVAPVVVGVFLCLLGLGGIFAGFSRRAMEWNNTHNRAFQRVPHYGRGQSLYNMWALSICGLIALAGGLAAAGIGLGLLSNT